MILGVTGTSTGVGKTVATAALAAALRPGGPVTVVKPAQTGLPDGADRDADGALSDAAEVARLGYELSPGRRFAVGQVFLPPDPYQRVACEQILEDVIKEEGQRLLGWRDVPIDTAHVGQVALGVMPVFRQIFVRMRRVPPSAWERTLYVIRKLAENRVRERAADPDGYFHVASLSTETIVYKGLLLPRQLPLFFPDLRAPEMVSAIAVVHSRFSTNTFPTWDLAQPFRYIAHNGEINTVRGNGNWMQARRSQLKSAKFHGGLERLHPIIVPGKSDSAQFNRDDILKPTFRS